MTCVVCVVCVTCVVCVFECQSVVNSNKRGHAAGVTEIFVKVAKMSQRLSQMLIVFHCGSVRIFDVSSGLDRVITCCCFFVILLFPCECQSQCCCSCHKSDATQPKLRIVFLHVLHVLSSIVAKSVSHARPESHFFLRI